MPRGRRLRDFCTKIFDIPVPVNYYVVEIWVMEVPFMASPVPEVVASQLILRGIRFSAQRLNFSLETADPAIVIISYTEELL